jgi:hypothetical protein
MPNPRLLANAKRYVQTRDAHITNCIGGGTDGTVWKTDQPSAIKVLELEKNYRMELGRYQRLADHGVRNVLGLVVPRILGWDDDLMVVEMELVSPPCLIDFAKAYLDWQPEHSKEQWEDHLLSQRDLWGEHFGDVQAILWKLEQIGIYYRDPKPANIMFEDWDLLE